MYLPDTNVLITRFLDADGVGEVSDFMPIGVYPYDHPHQLVRRGQDGPWVDPLRRPVRARASTTARAEHTVEQRDGELDLRVEG